MIYNYFAKNKYKQQCDKKFLYLLKEKKLKIII